MDPAGGDEGAKAMENEIFRFIRHLWQGRGPELAPLWRLSGGQTCAQSARPARLTSKLGAGPNLTTRRKYSAMCVCVC